MSVVEIYNKKTKETIEMPLKDFINPKSTSPEAAGLRPKGFQSATWMLIDLIGGELYQNLGHIVRLKGVQHKWEW